MKKFILTAFCLLFLMQATALASAVREIPYPPGLDTTSSGASSVAKTANHIPSPYFSYPDIYNLKSHGSLIILPEFATYQQTQEYTCGPAAALMMMYYYGYKNYTEMGLAKEMNTQGYPIGTNLDDIVKFFQAKNWHVEFNRKEGTFKSFDDFKLFVQNTLKAGHPIMVENARWGGHWYDIIGYDDMGTATTCDDVIICADSYDTDDHNQDGYTVQSAEQFFYTWFDGPSHFRKMMVQAYIIAYPVSNEANLYID